MEKFFDNRKREIFRRSCEIIAELGKHKNYKVNRHIPENIHFVLTRNRTQNRQIIVYIRISWLT